MIRVSVVGSTGYAGAELVRLLATHPRIHIQSLTSTSYVGQPYNQVYPSFGKRFDMPCVEEHWPSLVEQSDVIFCALPHGYVAKNLRPEYLEKVRVVDLGADFRLKSPEVFEQWYGMTHPQPELLKQAVYGLTEWNHQAIGQARLVANPGCYPTASALAVIPLLRDNLIEPDTIIIDAKSGISGAGRALALSQHYGEANETIKAYGLGKHRHTPEIEQSLSMYGLSPSGESVACPPVSFTPHLTPMNRGILATAYASLSPSLREKLQEDIEQTIRQSMMTAYEHETFVNVLPAGIFPETRWVRNSNRCDIGFAVDSRTGRIIVLSAIDNLVKGAAGQAIQNMNRMLDWPEDTGLEHLPSFI